MEDYATIKTNWLINYYFLIQNKPQYIAEWKKRNLLNRKGMQFYKNDTSIFT